MIIFSIDPGNKESAYLIFDSETETFYDKGIVNNEKLVLILRNVLEFTNITVIEGISCYGMAVGRSVFDTAIWIGRFIQVVANKEFDSKIVYRKDIKLHLCNSSRAKDSNIRQSLINRFGDCGTKKNPGKLYGVKKDIWSALAIAVFYADTYKNGSNNKV